MGQISGIASLFFIAMAFLTSCGPSEAPKGNSAPLITLSGQ